MGGGLKEGFAGVARVEGCAGQGRCTTRWGRGMQEGFAGGARVRGVHHQARAGRVSRRSVRHW